MQLWIVVALLAIAAWFVIGQHLRDGEAGGTPAVERSSMNEQPAEAKGAQVPVSQQSRPPEGAKQGKAARSERERK